MKKLIAVLIMTTLLFSMVFCISANAAETSENTKTTVEILENGDYIETVIIDYTAAGNSDYSINATQTKTGRKTSNYKNSSGAVLWSVSVTGTFSYNGTTSTCTSCSHSTTAPSSAWTIKSASHSKSGNTATARATATQKTSTGTKDFSMSVTLKCSANGTLS